MRALRAVRCTLALAILSVLAGAAVPTLAADGSPVGLWKNIDDASGKPTALIRISDHNGVLQGKIERLFLPVEQDQNPLCVKCEGALKDQPIVGMVILAGLKKSGAAYSGGHILDPGNGTSYKSKLTLIDGGNKLDVRGYLGVPMLGRSQIWLREQ
ncbi:DUF2147 domain-containing protein [Massilia sp. DWR3-1-1]|uniref:DUF2147 domain-containing protein n=1 Tax=Massilia sp. DWR3-1-1 TaxID=2804559 RepID=UPI003CF0B77D